MWRGVLDGILPRLTHAPDDHEDTDRRSGSSYWRSQAQLGRVLTGVEKEWAEAHAARLTRADKFSGKLREAGRLGNQHAPLDMAERFGDPLIFERLRHNFGTDPAAIAERLGRMADAVVAPAGAFGEARLDQVGLGPVHSVGEPGLPAAGQQLRAFIRG